MTTATKERIKRRITLSREQTIILTDKIRVYSPHIIQERPQLVDFVKTISQDMGCEVSRHAVRETFLVLNKQFTEWPRKESSGKDRHKSRKTVAQLVKTVQVLGSILRQCMATQGHLDASLQIKQALADLEAVEKKDAPDLFAGVGS